VGSSVGDKNGGIVHNAAFQGLFQQSRSTRSVM
jgi:hypothetical protein